ncbi:MAG: hypothetical protein QM813_22435 [Verrucomicrobiota bacterium]
MTFKELLLTGFRRKLIRPRFLATLGLLLGSGVFLILSSGGQGGFFYAGIFAVLYAMLAPVTTVFHFVPHLHKIRLVYRANDTDFWQLWHYR